MDTNTRRRNADEALRRKSFYGQLKHIYVVKMPATSDLCGPRETPREDTLVLAVVQSFILAKHRIAKSTPVSEGTGRLEVVDMTSVQCLVGRVSQGRNWAFIDRTRAILPSSDHSETNIVV